MTLVVEQALPAKSKSDEEGVHSGLFFVVSVLALPLLSVPSTMLTVEPFTVSVDPVRVVVLEELSAIETETAFEPLPFQPETTELGSTDSLKTKLTLSPFSAFPAVPPALFEVAKSAPARAVLAIVTEKLWLRELPSTSASASE